ncbi:MAG: YgaP family membrane protein [Ignavibacteria bacterium]
MKKNVGKTDQILRTILGIVLLIFAVIDPSKNWWGFLGIIPLLTAYLRFCPAYLPFKINTSKEEK